MTIQNVNTRNASPGFTYLVMISSTSGTQKQTKKITLVFEIDCIVPP